MHQAAEKGSSLKPGFRYCRFSETQRMFGYRKEPGQLTIRMRSHSASRIANMRDVDSAWLEWTRRLQAIAQSGLTYAKDPYDVERYEQVRQIAAEIAASHTEAPVDRIDDLFSRESGYATPKLDIRAVVLTSRRRFYSLERRKTVCGLCPAGG